MAARPKRTAKAAEYWRGVIAEQEGSGLRIRPFCRERGVGEHSFYLWRRRLQAQPAPTSPPPVRFALVERRSDGVAAQPNGAEDRPTGTLELHLPTGEQLRIPTGVDGDTLRTVLTALRAQHA